MYYLVKEKGYTLDGAKEVIRNNASQARDKMEAIENLRRIRAFLLDLKGRL